LVALRFNGDVVGRFLIRKLEGQHFEARFSALTPCFSLRQEILLYILSPFPAVKRLAAKNWG